MPSKAHLEEQKRALKMIHPQTWGVKVKTEQGDICYRDVSEVKPDDTIIMKKDGTPAVMVKKPGRKNKIKLSPHKQSILDDRNRIVQSHPLSTSVREDPESMEVFHHIINGMAKGIATLEFEAEQALLKGHPTVQVISKQMTAMRSAADLWLKRRDQLTSKMIDLNSSAFKELFKFIMDTFRTSLKNSGLRQEQIETIFGNLSTLVDDGWEEEAKNRMRDK